MSIKLKRIEGRGVNIRLVEMNPTRKPPFCHVLDLLIITNLFSLSFSHSDAHTHTHTL